MPHLGVPELLIILLIFVLIFGVGRLPEIGKALGQSVREFKEAAREEETSEATSHKSTNA